MSSRLIVRNIPKHMTENQLKDKFTKFGKVTDVKILFKGNIHRRFCFVGSLWLVGYKDNFSAEQAKEYFNNTYIDTSKITVDYASTLNDDKILKERQLKVKKLHGSSKAPTRSTTKTDKLAKYARDLGLDSDAILGKRLPTETEESTKLDGQPGDNGKENDKEHVAISEAKGDKKIKSAEAVPGLDSKRLYVYNFPFSITKEELRLVFEKYGKVSECIIPSDDQKKSKGFGYVSFEDENDAIRAFAELDNTIVFGRIIHMKPSYESRKSVYTKDKEKDKKAEGGVKSEVSSYKRVKKEEFQKNLEDDASWNSLFLNPNTVMEYVAHEYGLTKTDLLNREVDNPAVKISLAETKIINETKEWLQENGVNISAFESVRKTVPRSRTTIIIKNLPKDITKNKLSELLNRYGFVNRLLLPNNKTIAIAQFRNIDHAKNAFSKLSGFMFQGAPLYLEYSPENLIPEQPDEEEAKEESDRDENIMIKPIPNTTNTLQDKAEEGEADEAKARTVFVKNLNFKTTEDGLRNFLRDEGFIPLVKYLKIIVKNAKSCGYGFIEFNTKEAAEKALRSLNMKILDGHKLELTISREKVVIKESNKKDRLDLEPTNKIIIRNVDFAAAKKELRELVAAFGEVRAVRMPSKVTGEHRGYAFVEFSNVEEAKNAYDALSHTHLYGRKLVIEYAKE